MEATQAVSQAAVTIPLANLLVIAGVVVFVVVAVLFAIKKGWISFKGKGLDVGYSEIERKIIRQQMQLMHSEVDALVQVLPKDLEHYRTKYVLSKVKDCFEEMIIYNHITDDDEYIGLKQIEICNMVLKLTDHEYFRTPEFKEFAYKFIADVIKRFVRIRKYYQKNK